MPKRKKPEKRKPGRKKIKPIRIKSLRKKTYKIKDIDAKKKDLVKKILKFRDDYLKLGIDMNKFTVEQLEFHLKKLKEKSKEGKL